MKRITYLLFTLAFVLVFNGNAFAQIVDARAEVVSELSYDNGNKQAVNFANISASLDGNEPVLDPTDNTVATNISGGTPTLGYLKGTATANAEISIAFANEVLENEDINSDHQITFEPHVCVDASDTRTSVQCQAGTDFTTGNTVSLEDDETDFTIWVGGTLTSPQDSEGATASTLDAGSYEGTLSFTIDYTF